MTSLSVLKKIKHLLDTNKISYLVFDHAPVYTSLDAAKIRNADVSLGTKALVLVADKQPILVVVPGDKKANFKEIKKHLKVKDLRMASVSEVKDLTTLKVGSIPPLGSVLGLKSYFDKNICNKDDVFFNAGMHTTSIKMKASDLIKVESPVILSLT